MFRKQQVFFGGFPIAFLTLFISFFAGASFWIVTISTLLAGIGATLLLLAFGLRKIPVGFKALKLWLGARQADEVLSEGWQWWWPKPLGEFLEVDCRVKNLDIPLKKVLTSDKVAVEMDVSLSYHIGPSKREDGTPITSRDWADALNRYTNVGDEDFQRQLKEEAAEKFRAAASGVDSGKIHQSQNDILQGTDDSHGVVKALQNRTKEFGVNIKEVQIANITLPADIVDAAAQEKAEEGQKKAEAIERQGIEAAIDSYKAKGLSPAEAARLHAVERGKIKETVQTVNIPGIEAVGGMIAGALAGKLTPTKTKNEEDSE